MACHYAHYDKKTGKKQFLHDHLMNPVEQVVEAIPPSVLFPGVPYEEVKEVARWVYLLHDFGKYTDYFQDYLLNDVASAEKGHSFISACLTYAFLLKYYGISTHHEAMKAFLGFICVLRHHSSLEVIEILDKEAQSEQKCLKRQASQLQKKLPAIFAEAPWSRYFDEQTMQELLKVQKLFENERLFWMMPARMTGKRQYENYWYFPLVFLFSLLIDTDKIDSVGFERRRVQATEPDKVVSYLQEKNKGQESELIDRRERARRTIVGTIDNLTDEQVKQQRFFTLTAPTGIGKTLASLQAALKLQNRISQLEGYTPRIIAAIPFINIIEQTRQDYEAIFPDSLVVHHRLADFTEQKPASPKEQENISVDRQLMQVEAWEGNVVLTTFVQLFHSLLTGSNRLLKKINKLAGSIVILDEIQSIAYEKMPLIGALLQKVAEFYGTRFILMTATQPMLLEEGTKLLNTFVQSERSKNLAVIELLPDYSQYFEVLTRTQFIPCMEKRMDASSFCDFVLERINQYQLVKNGESTNNKEQNKSLSALIVVNTIQRSIDVFEQLKKMRREKKFSQRTILVCLSTNLIPKHRRHIINFVRKCLEKGKAVILVSTQTIEAGVDLDFDIGFRDLAPLPALIQTAGRINREGRKGIFCPLYIVHIEKDSSWVYSTNEMSVTKDLLQGKEQILESEYQSLVKVYYQKVSTGNGLDSTIKDIWELGVLGLDFQELKKFSLIDSIGEVADVFIEYDKEATQIAQAYRELLGQSENVDWTAIRKVFPSVKEEPELSEFTRRSLLRLVGAKLSDYIVQIRIKKIVDKHPFDFGNNSSLFWVPKSEKRLYYSPRTGYKAEHQAFIY